MKHSNSKEKTQKEKTKDTETPDVIERLLTIANNTPNFRKRAGFSNSYLERTKSVGSPVLKRIHAAFPELSTDWILYGEGDMIKSSLEALGIKSLPVFDVYGHAGTTTYVNTMEDAQIINYIKVPGFEDCLGWIRVKGDCMAPFLKNGAHVALKQSDMNNVSYGSAYFILFNGDFPREPEIKYIRKGKDKDHWLLRSHDSKNYEDQDIPIALIRTIYRVRGRIDDI
jgi:hypothetical protein